MQQLTLLSDPECSRLSQQLEQQYGVFWDVCVCQDTPLLRICQDIAADLSAINKYISKGFKGHICFVAQNICEILPLLREVHFTPPFDSLTLIDGNLELQKTAHLALSHHAFLNQKAENSHPAQLSSIWLSTANAFELDSYQVLPDFAHLGDLPETILRVQMATGEAYANSLLHGNLQVNHHKRENENYNGDFASDIDHRLHNGDCANRLIGICASLSDQKINIRLVNEGNGFEPEVKVAEAQDHKPFRGLSLLDQFTDHFAYSDNGRILDLNFNLNG